MEFEDRRLPKGGPGAEELRAMGALLPGGVKDLVSLRGRHWKAQGVDIEALDDTAVIRHILADPLSLRRPILWRGDSVVLGYAADAYRNLA